MFFEQNKTISLNYHWTITACHWKGQTELLPHLPSYFRLLRWFFMPLSLLHFTIIYSPPLPLSLSISNPQTLPSSSPLCFTCLSTIHPQPTLHPRTAQPLLLWCFSSPRQLLYTKLIQYQSPKCPPGGFCRAPQTHVWSMLSFEERRVLFVKQSWACLHKPRLILKCYWKSLHLTSTH